MTETIKESLLNNLLKSYYPLTDYLYRQQEFAKVFSITQTNSESETNVIRARKTPLPSSYTTLDPKISEFNSDQDENTAHDQSSEIDDEKPLLKSIKEENVLKQ